MSVSRVFKRLEEAVEDLKKRPGDKTKVVLIKGAIIYLDIEGFTEITYQCTQDEAKMGKFCDLLGSFWKRMEQHGLGKSIHIVNNAGDAFVALCDDASRKRTNASVFAASLLEQFSETFKKFPESIGYRFVPRIQIGLHYGTVYLVSRNAPGSAFDIIFIGDAINVAARICSSTTARQCQIACSDQFHERLVRSESEKYHPKETLYDRNKYPEPIEIYGYAGAKPVRRKLVIRSSRGSGQSAIS